MFGFLKKRIKNVIDSISGKFSEKVRKITRKKVSEDEFNEIFHDFEITLLENNVALEVVEQIKKCLESEIVNNEIAKPKQKIHSSLKKAISEILIEGSMGKKDSPAVVMFIGVNGVGKTTSLAKLAYLMKKSNKKVVFAASDTFRAASIEQLEVHAEKLGIKVLKHDYGADAAAVAFDAVSYAKKHGIDYVFIDTAGRMQSNKNLMDELKKIKRVAKPDYTVFVGDSLTGNDAVEQARKFNEEIGIDFSILTKADADSKGGAILSIGFVTNKPIMFLGTGQGYGDLKKFKKSEILDKIF